MIYITCNFQYDDDYQWSLQGTRSNTLIDRHHRIHSLLLASLILSTSFRVIHLLGSGTLPVVAGLRAEGHNSLVPVSFPLLSSTASFLQAAIITLPYLFYYFIVSSFSTSPYFVCRVRLYCNLGLTVNLFSATCHISLGPGLSNVQHWPENEAYFGTIL